MHHPPGQCAALQTPVRACFVLRAHSLALCKGIAPSKQALVRSPSCTLLIGTCDRGAMPAKYGPGSGPKQRLGLDIASMLGHAGTLEGRA